MKTSVRNGEFLWLTSVLMACGGIAGCTTERHPRPASATSSPSSEPSPVPSVSRDEAITRLDRLVARIRDLRRGETQRVAPGLGYTMVDGSSNRVAEITLRAEFTIGCDCCYYDVSSEVTDEDIAWFGCFDDLEVLKIPNAALKGPGLAAIGRLKNLRELDLSMNPLQDKALEHLAGLENLKSLALDATEIRGEGLRHLAGLPRLERLSVQNCRLSPAGWAALGTLTQLKHLHFTAAKIPEDPDDRHLNRLAQLRSLESVSLDTYAYRSSDGGSSTSIRMEHEPLEADRVFLELARLPKLVAISFAGILGRPTPKGLDNFPNPAPLESLGSTLILFPDEVATPADPSAGSILERFAHLRSLRVHVDCSQLSADSPGRVQIGNMDSLESLTVSAPEREIDCFVHDLPNLRWLRIGPSLALARRAKEMPEPSFHQVRLENLPRLESLDMAIPRDLVVRNVGALRPADGTGQAPNGAGVHCNLYGRFTDDVARQLASIAGLKRLDLLPHHESAPRALRAFRHHPTFSEIGVRIEDAPRLWIESIAGLRETLHKLELPPHSLGQSESDRRALLDAETLAPLARMVELRELRLDDVVDPVGEPVSWVSDLPHLERFVLARHDIGRLHVRLPCAAHWTLNRGYIHTLEISEWPESSHEIDLDGSFKRFRMAKEEPGQIACWLDVWGHVRHYVFRDMPHVTLINLKGVNAKTITLEGDLSALTKIRDACMHAELFVAPGAKVGEVTHDRR